MKIAQAHGQIHGQIHGQDQWIELPLFPIQKNNFEDEVISGFLQAVRQIEFMRPHNVRQAIEIVADKTQNSAANIARILVEQGLKAPKEAFPISFLQHVLEKRHIPVWQKGAATPAQESLIRFWTL